MSEHKSADRRCVACDAEVRLSGYPRYTCCSGTDCGCYGATIPDSFCSLSCYENWDDSDADEEEVEWDGEGLEGDDELTNCHAFVDGGVFVCGAVGSEDCDKCIFHSDLGKTVSEVESEMEMSDDE